MTFFKRFKWLVIILSLIFIAGLLYIRYDNKDFLRYGVLHIKKFPHSLKIISDESSGLTDQQYIYLVSIEPNELSELLKGRKYIKQSNDQMAQLGTPDNFSLKCRYTSGTLNTGLVNIFVNTDKSLVYIVYFID